MNGGIIPAYAGSTRRSATIGAIGEDHPRIRGEHSRLSRSRSFVAGSSPHTRGALLEVDERQVGLRIIPAYAGSTSSAASWIFRCSDHPRIRGEHTLRRRPARYRRGSSPHTRGAPSFAFGSAVRRGIIPAYAGSTTSSPPRGAGRGDHPRIRGEHKIRSEYSIIVSGSSPHTRGALQLVYFRVVRAGIIPAYAGSTGGRWLGAVPGGGSSPHTRGALPDAAGDPPLDGIIPAYAGSTTEHWCLGYAK